MGAYTTIDDPSAHFQATAYSGAGASTTVTNGGNSDLKPDWLWIKNRTGAYAHALFDSNRGLGSSSPPMLESDSTAVENANQNWISAVGTDGFTIGVNEHNLSNSSSEYVAWQWKGAGGTTASNSNGSITSTVQANTTAGFSIVTYTGTGSVATVGHGLGVKPDMMILKNRDSAVNWIVFHKDINTSANYFLRLNTTDATQYSGGRFNGTQPTSSVFTVGTSSQTNNNGDDIVAYCFASKQGYSKFGQYIGNGNSGNTGAFVFTGFKPNFVMLRETGNSNSWWMFDTARDTYNTADARLVANTTAAEATGSFTDVVNFLSNGFKIKNSDSAWNRSGGTYIYMAFAENPFVTSDDGGSIPTTAR